MRTPARQVQEVLRVLGFVAKSCPGLVVAEGVELGHAEGMTARVEHQALGLNPTTRMQLELPELLPRLQVILKTTERV